MLKTPKLILKSENGQKVLQIDPKGPFRDYKSLGKIGFLYIGTGILKVCENAKKSQMQLQKIALGYQTVKMLKLYFSMYPDSHKDPARQKMF